MTERVLVLEPVPQVLVQAAYLDQEETLQSTGQVCELQVRSISEGHSSPPWEAARVTANMRDWTPVPQEREQAVQAFHLCSQSMAHGWVLQLRLEMRLTQARPP